MAHTFDSFPLSSPGLAAKPAARFRNVWVAVVIALAVTAIVILQTNAARHRDAQRTAIDLWATRDLSQSERLINKLIDTTVYNRTTTYLNESFPVTLRVIANPALATFAACRPPDRLQFKAHIVAPTFDAQTSLDDVVSLPDGVRHFSWMLTPHQTGLEQFRVRGIVYCMSPQSVITMRQTVVDSIRAIEVAQPLVFSVDNWTTLGNALLGLIASTGALAFLRDLFHHHGTEKTA